MSRVPGGTAEGVRIRNASAIVGWSEPLAGMLTDTAPLDVLLALRCPADRNWKIVVAFGTCAPGQLQIPRQAQR